MTLRGEMPGPSGRLVARKLAREPEVRRIHLSDELTLSVEERMTRRGSNDHDESIQVADGDRMSGVDTEGAVVRYWLTGPVPQNEEGSLEVCHALVRVLNAETGSSWSQPSLPDGPEDGTDGESVSPEGDVLAIQVTRATGDPSLWASLAAEGKVAREARIPELVEALWDAIGQKQHLADKAKFCLALDARFAIELALPVVVEFFKSQHGDDLRNLAFRQVWLVGPIDGLTFRLDE